MTALSLRKLADLVALTLGAAGLFALLGAVLVWITSPAVELGAAGKPAVVSTEHGLRPTTEIVVHPTLNSLLAHQERLHEALSIALLGSALIIGAAAGYGVLRAMARFRPEG